jgi:hypothetical protein
MKMCGGVDVQFDAFLTSALGGFLFDSTPPPPPAAPFNLWYFVEEALGLRGGQDAVEKKNSLLLPGIESRFLGHQTHSLTAILAELSRHIGDSKEW